MQPATDPQTLSSAPTWLERLGRPSPLWHRLILLAGCVVLYLVWLMWMPLTEIDEARYAEATRYMVATGNYIIPHFNGHQRYQKPILYYWVQAPAVKLLGLTETAARFPSALLVIVLVLLIHGALLHWLTAAHGMDDPPGQARARGAAFLGAAVLATIPLIAVWARAATTDATLTLFTTLTMLALLQADLDRRADDRGRWWYLLAGAAAGFAFLTKGPVGLVLPGLTWIIYHLSLKQLRAETRRLPWLPTFALFFVIAVPWYVATYFVDGWGFLKRFFLTENAERFLSSGMEGHGSKNRLMNLAAYIPMIVLALSPYTGFLLGDLITPWAGRAEAVFPTSLARIRRFCWVWITSVLGFFAISSTQLPSYFQSIVGAVAILIALSAYAGTTAIPADAATPRRRFASNLTVVGLVLVLGSLWPVAVILLLTGKLSLDGPIGTLPFLEGPAHFCITALVVAGGLFLLGGIVTACRRPSSLIGWTTLTWTLIFGVLALGAGPLIVRSAYGLSAATGQYLHCSAAANEPVLEEGSQASESMVYYAQRPIEFFSAADDKFTRALEVDLHFHGSAVVICKDRIADLLATYGVVTPLTVFGDATLVRVTRRK